MNKKIYRFTLILQTIAIIIMAVVELAVAFDVELTRSLTRKAMWVGTLLWVILLTANLVNKYICKEKGHTLWYTATFAIITQVVVLGMFVPTFSIFTIWANVALWTLVSIMMVLILPKMWRNCADTNGKV